MEKGHTASQGMGVSSWASILAHFFSASSPAPFQSELDTTRTPDYDFFLCCSRSRFGPWFGLEYFVHFPYPDSLNLIHIWAASLAYWFLQEFGGKCFPSTVENFSIVILTISTHVSAPLRAEISERAERPLLFMLSPFSGTVPGVWEQMVM